MAESREEQVACVSGSLFDARLFSLGLVLGLLISAGVFVLIGELMT